MESNLSICIPVYFPPLDMFKHVLSNVVHATKNLNKFEVLLGIQDCSPETRNLINEYHSKHQFFRIIDYDKSVSTRAKNRNELLRNAKNDIVILIDQDMYITEALVDSHLKVHHTFPNAYVSGKAYNRTELNEYSEKLLSSCDMSNVYELLSHIKSIACMEDPRVEPLAIKSTDSFVNITNVPGCWLYFWTCNLSVRKSTINKIGYFDDTFNGWGVEDDELAWRAFNSNCTMVYSAEAWGFHYPHPINFLKNHNDWLGNMGRFLKKANTIQVECYSIFLDRFNFGYKAYDASIANLNGCPSLDFLF